MVSKGRQAPEPAFGRMSYGPDPLQYMTIWLAEASQPSPVVVQFYPGGFTVGGGRRRSNEATSTLTPIKAADLPPLRAKAEILKLLDVGISVVAVAHRRPDLHPAPAPFDDAARAVQFIRSQAPAWNIDTERIAATGASSGGCLALWLACHPERARPRAKDPVERQSTRLCCVAVNSAVTSLDSRFLRELLPGTSEHAKFHQLFDFDPDDVDRLTADTYRLMEQMSPIHHVASDSPPALLCYDREMDAPRAFHHPCFGAAFKEQMDAVGATCDVIAKGRPLMGSRKSTIPAFLKRHLLRDAT